MFWFIYFVAQCVRVAHVNGIATFALVLPTANDAAPVRMPTFAVCTAVSDGLPELTCSYLHSDRVRRTRMPRMPRMRWMPRMPRMPRMRWMPRMPQMRRMPRMPQMRWMPRMPQMPRMRWMPRMQLLRMLLKMRMLL